MNREEEYEESISDLRFKLWKEGKIRIEGYTYEEWLKRNDTE